jgi:hypothetical protein
MTKCLINCESLTIRELEEELLTIDVKIGYVGEVVEHVMKNVDSEVPTLVKVKLPYFGKQSIFQSEWEYKKLGYFEVLLPYKCVTEVEEYEE